MSKKDTANPPLSGVEEVEVFAPPGAPDAAEPRSLPVPRLRTMPDLGRGLRWGSILLGALGGLVSLLASLWLYD